MHPAHDRRDVLGTRRRNAHKLDGVSGCVQRKHTVGGRGVKVGVQPQVRPEALCDSHASPERSLDAKSTRLLQGSAPHLVDVAATHASTSDQIRQRSLTSVVAGRGTARNRARNSSPTSAPLARSGRRVARSNPVCSSTSNTASEAAFSSARVPPRRGANVELSDRA